MSHSLLNDRQRDVDKSLLHCRNLKVAHTQTQNQFKGRYEEYMHTHTHKISSRAGTRNTCVHTHTQVGTLTCSHSSHIMVFVNSPTKMRSTKFIFTPSLPYAVRHTRTHTQRRQACSIFKSTENVDENKGRA